MHAKYYIVLSETRPFLNLPFFSKLRSCSGKKNGESWSWLSFLKNYILKFQYKIMQMPKYKLY